MGTMRGWFFITVALAAAACGGGSSSSFNPGSGASGSSSSGGTSSGSSGGSYVAGVYDASSTLASRCATPRTGTDPSTGKPYADVAGSVLLEGLYLRSWTNELYFWYKEVPDINPSSYTTANYFAILKTSGTTASGTAKDKFHFTYPTAQWVALSQSNVAPGYGADFEILSAYPPRAVVVGFTEPNSPATDPAINLARGAIVLAVDGVDLIYSSDATSVNVLNNGLWPSAAGATHTFTILDLGATASRTITMTSANVTSVPVQNVGTTSTDAGPVGYMLFNDHMATSEQMLIDAFRQLASARVTDLVLDVRYNGGGYLDIASEVAYMIAGSGPTKGRTFEKTVFNDKYPTRDPVTGLALTPVPFYTTAQGYSAPVGQALPTLNLTRVAVLTSASTCSASESIINSLRGVGVQVVQVGATTCGKPYGFYPQDNCGTTYFSIELQGVNDQNFGDYADGFTAENSTAGKGVKVPGCAVADDLQHQLGDPAEHQLAAALGYFANQTCPAPTATDSRGPQAGEPISRPFPWREIRLLRR